MELRWIPALLLLAIAITPASSALHEFMPCNYVTETCETQWVVEEHAVSAYEACEKIANRYGLWCSVGFVEVPTQATPPA